jgi:Niemann-Pick C1 protein
VIGLGYGALFLKIIVDPVELWANPNSRSRIEKDYFDTRFGPFYRTSQIFIKPIKTDNVRTNNLYSTQEGVF